MSVNFQGFEHLLENLGLGRLVFEKSHALSLHKVNGSFQEVHDSLNLHHHSHSSNNGSQPIKRRKRQINAKDSGNNAGPKVTAYAEPKPVSWSSHCLTPQDLLLTFGLEPHHKAIISQRIFLEICPAIIYELDQRSCYTGTREQITTTEHKGVQASPSAVWLYSSLSVLVISLIGLLGVAIVPLVQRAFFQQILHFLVALAVGTMCGDALLHLLPHVSNIDFFQSHCS
ncbi:hypothetical protein C0J52_15622 [Blattella germanica]|nr:hypothetical protein C0J52_15622 [Blattella germanica]